MSNTVPVSRTFDEIAGRLIDTVPDHTVIEIVNVVQEVR